MTNKINHPPLLGIIPHKPSDEIPKGLTALGFGTTPLHSVPKQKPVTALAPTFPTEDAKLLYARLAPPTPVKPTYDSSPIQAFISYENTDVNYATDLRIALEKYNIEAFVAAKDARDAEEFPDEILKALSKMEFFISIHTEQFSKSVWCQQEVGFAIAKDVKIIPIKLTGIPDGFIRNTNAITIEVHDIKNVIRRILKILKEHPKTQGLYSAKIASLN